MALTQVSTDGVKNDAISHNKIPANAVQASELADNAVDTAAIAANAVTTTDIQDDAVVAAKLATNSVGIDALNLSDGTSGQVLVTDGSGTISFSEAGAKSDIFWENAQTLSASYSLAANRSAMSAGPITLGSGVTVTLGSNARWSIV